MTSNRLFLGFFLLLGLASILLLQQINEAQNELYSQVKKTLSAREQRSTALEQMMSAARERSLTILRMSYEPDPFARDELAQSMPAQASRFIHARMVVEEIGLPTEESQNFTRMMNLVSRISMLQQGVVEMLIEDRHDEATASLMADILPGQDTIIRALNELHERLGTTATNTLQAKQSQLEKNREYFYLLITWVIVFTATSILMIWRKFRLEEARLQNLKRINDSVLDTAFDAIISIDIWGTISRFNPAASQLLGYSAGEAIGQNISMLMPEPYASHHDSYLARYLRTGKSRAMMNASEFTVLHKDGHEISVSISLSDTQVDGPQRFTGILHDLTNIKAAQRELMQQKSALDQHSIVSVTDTEGTINYINDSFVQVSGYRREELIGNNHRIVSSGYRSDSHWRSMYQTLLSGQTWRHEIKNRNKAGKYYWLDTTIVPFLGPDGTPEKYISISTDISQLKQIESELQEHKSHLEQTVSERTREMMLEKQKAEEANKEKSRFLANMSHELRTPMHAVLSFARLGLKRLDDADHSKTEGYLQRIIESAERLTDLLNDLLDLSKLEAGSMNFSYEKNDLDEVIGSVAVELSELANNKSIAINIDAPHEPLTGYFDRTKIMQVVRNLVANAIKFSAEHTAIDISLQRLPLGPSDAPDQAIFQVCIADQGVGIPEEELEAVFDRFTQSSKTRTQAGGTGLGLAISNEIVQAHGGRIFASNNPHGGASFTFELPQAGAAGSLLSAMQA